MKKIYFFRITGIVSALALVLSSFSQYSGLTMNLNRKALINSARTLIAKEEADKVAIENLKLINMKIFKDFSKSFANAAGISVRQTDKSTFISFNADDARQRVCYNAKGRRMYSIQYYGVDKIPLDVLDLVKSEFPKYTVLRGTEVNVGGKVAHLVDIENSRSFKTIRVIDDAFDIYSSVNK